jgi:hypothetical protein
MSAIETHIRLPVLALALGVALTACDRPSTPEGNAVEPPAAPSSTSAAAAALNPLPGRTGVTPGLTQRARVKVETTAGDAAIEVYP